MARHGECTTPCRTALAKGVRIAWCGRVSALLPVVLRSQRGEERVARHGECTTPCRTALAKGVRSAWCSRRSAILPVGTATTMAVSARAALCARVRAHMPLTSAWRREALSLKALKPLSRWTVSVWHWGVVRHCAHVPFCGARDRRAFSHNKAESCLAYTLVCRPCASSAIGPGAGLGSPWLFSYLNRSRRAVTFSRHISPPSVSLRMRSGLKHNFPTTYSTARRPRGATPPQGGGTRPSPSPHPPALRGGGGRERQ